MSTRKTLKEIYLMPFNALAAGIRLFMRNRKLTKDFTRKTRIAEFAKIAMLVTLAVWLLIAFLTRGEEDGRLEEAMKSLWTTGNITPPAAPSATTPAGQ